MIQLGKVGYGYDNLRGFPREVFLRPPRELPPLAVG